MEPMGLLFGEDAAAAVRLGLALPLGDGLAFTMARLDGSVVPVAGLTAPPAPAPWAGLPGRALVMGIVNVTPDSFSNGGEQFAVADAVASGRRMVSQGADILDVGGESTRPGALPVPVDEEMRRVLPVIAGLAGCGAPVSVDTRNAATMAAALAAGAAIVNDVSGLAHDAGSAAVVARAGCPVVLMHMRGTPESMAGLAEYGDLAAEVTRELGASLARAEAAGVRRADIALDPGVGFAKRAGQNPELLRRLPSLLEFGCRVLVGVSRKRFLDEGGTAMAPKARLPASLAAGLYALSRGASILRVHDVAETVQAIRAWQAMVGPGGAAL